MTTKQEQVEVFESIARALVNAGDRLDGIEADESMTEESVAYLGGLFVALMTISRAALKASKQLE